MRCQKSAGILRFFAPKNFRGVFHESIIARVLLTPKPRGVANFTNASYRRVEILRRENKMSGGETEAKLVLWMPPAS